MIRVILCFCRKLSRFFVGWFLSVPTASSDSIPAGAENIPNTSGVLTSSRPLIGKFECFTKICKNAGSFRSYSEVEVWSQSMHRIRVAWRPPAWVVTQRKRSRWLLWLDKNSLRKPLRVLSTSKCWFSLQFPCLSFNVRCENLKLQDKIIIVSPFCL